jgi:hypothetical protein
MQESSAASDSDAAFLMAIDHAHPGVVDAAWASACCTVEGRGLRRPQSILNLQCKPAGNDQHGWPT